MPLSRTIPLLLCVPSGAILLMKAFGVMEMHTSGLFIFLPSIVLLIIYWIYKTKRSAPVSHVLLAGFWAGLLGTVCYDIIRVPYFLAGHQVFAPIRMYGVWLTDASSGNALTDLVGWLYHFSNGITFGMGYMLIMQHQRIFWAILYALALETVFLLSPFGAVFGITSQPVALVVAYIGHVAYGYPLGYFARYYNRCLQAILYFRKAALFFFVTLLLVGLVFFPYSPVNKNKNTSTIRITASSIQPFITRISYHDTVTFFNETGNSQLLLIPSLGLQLPIENKATLSFSPGKKGIIFVHLENINTTGTFVISEPVEGFKK